MVLEIIASAITLGNSLYNTFMVGSTVVNATAPIVGAAGSVYMGYEVMKIIQDAGWQRFGRNILLLLFVAAMLTGIYFVVHKNFRFIQEIFAGSSIFALSFLFMILVPLTLAVLSLASLDKAGTKQTNQHVQHVQHVFDASEHPFLKSLLFSVLFTVSSLFLIRHRPTKEIDAVGFGLCTIGLCSNLFFLQNEERRTEIVSKVTLTWTVIPLIVVIYFAPDEVFDYIAVHEIGFLHIDGKQLRRYAFSLVCGIGILWYTVFDPTTRSDAWKQMFFLLLGTVAGLCVYLFLYFVVREIFSTVLTRFFFTPAVLLFWMSCWIFAFALVSQRETFTEKPKSQGSLSNKLLDGLGYSWQFLLVSVLCSLFFHFVRIASSSACEDIQLERPVSGTDYLFALLLLLCFFYLYRTSPQSKTPASFVQWWNSSPSKVDWRMLARFGLAGLVVGLLPLIHVKSFFTYIRNIRPEIGALR